MIPLRAFISYSHQDSSTARQIADRFAQLGIPYFVDEKNLFAGESITNGIEDQISRCSHLVVVLSAASRKSQWVPYEIGFARARGLSIVSLLTHPAEEPLSIVRDLKCAASLDELTSYFEGLAATRAKSKEHFEAIRRPHEDAKALADQIGHKEPVVGKVIEVWVDQSLESMDPLEDLGIDPKSVTFSKPFPRNFDDLLIRCGGLREFPPPNSQKFGIARLPTGTSDDSGLNIEFSRTDWNTWMSVRTFVEKNTELRHAVCHVNPENNSLPQSMSLQFIVRFSNGDVLVMKRKKGLASYPGSWSFSGEEQLHSRDFERPSDQAAEHFFRRAFIEEVFGKRDATPELFDRIWAEDCSKLVRSHRLWGFFLEESVGIIQMLGVYHLNVTPSFLRRVHEAAVSAGWGTTDPEGDWYIATESEVAALLTVGSCYVTRLHGHEERKYLKDDESLHSTSRYRLWRLYHALNRTPQTLGAVTGI